MLRADKIVFGYNKNVGQELDFHSRYLTKDTDIILKNSYVYPPLINSHDHLVGNWLPPALDHAPYLNSHIWVEDMKKSLAYLERNKYWINKGMADLSSGAELSLSKLGVYKNIFSGVGIVQDHSPNQKDKYYQSFPIQVIKKYRQLHSIELGNWWGGKSLEEEWKLSSPDEPFILHIGEGTDSKTAGEFSLAKEYGMLQENVIFVHAISFTKSEIAECAKNGVSICWCPTSNLNLIGRTLDVETAIKEDINLIVGTDSSFSGSLNLFRELKLIHKLYPNIKSNVLFKFIYENPLKAFFLENYFLSKTDSLLAINKNNENHFDNILNSDINDINLFVWKEVPIYGDFENLKFFDIDIKNYFIFKSKGKLKFVFGHPELLNREVDLSLGYHKKLAYLPFS
jgi:hypothetical protein